MVRMSTERDEAVFQDNEESCPASFKSFVGLLRHLNIGKHKKSLQLYKAEDYALKTYLEKIEEIDRSRTIPVIIDDIVVATVMSTKENDELEGWMLKSVRQFQLFSNDVINFLTNNSIESKIKRSSRQPWVHSNQICPFL
jgi:hypothetical protein